MKRFIFIVFLVSSFFIGSAQEFRYGIIGGVNLNTMKLANDLYINSDMENTEKLMVLGFNIGGFGEYSFNKHIGVQANLYYSQYGYRLINEYKYPMGANEYVFTDKEERVVNDISLSLMLKWYVLNKRLAIDLGVQPNFVCNVRSVELSSFGIDSLNVNIQHEVISDTTYLMKKDVEYLPFTLSVIGGMTYYFNDMFLMSVRYSFGLTDLFVKEVGYLDDNDNYYVDRIKQLSRDRVIQIGFGIRF